MNKNELIEILRKCGNGFCHNDCPYIDDNRCNELYQCMGMLMIDAANMLNGNNESKLSKKGML